MQRAGLLRQEEVAAALFAVPAALPLVAGAEAAAALPSPAEEAGLAELPVSTEEEAERESVR